MTDIFFIQDGQQLPIGEIGELYIPASTASEQRITTTEQAEFSFDLAEQRLKIEAILQEVLGITRMVLDIVSENGHGRIAHLARHGRKARTRKKNKNRAFRLLQKEEYLCK